LAAHRDDAEDDRADGAERHSRENGLNGGGVSHRVEFPVVDRVANPECVEQGDREGARSGDGDGSKARRKGSGFAQLACHRMQEGHRPCSVPGVPVRAKNDSSSVTCPAVTSATGPAATMRPPAMTTRSSAISAT